MQNSNDDGGIRGSDKGNWEKDNASNQKTRKIEMNKQRREGIIQSTADCRQRTVQQWLR